MRNADQVNRPHAMYYAATLLFVALDYGFDVNLRAAFLADNEAYRVLYYVFLFVCLGLVQRFPDKATYVGTLESGISVCALIINFWTRLLTQNETVLNTGDGWVTFPEVINFLIAGLYGYYAYATGTKRINDTKIR